MTAHIKSRGRHLCESEKSNWTSHVAGSRERCHKCVYGPSKASCIRCLNRYWNKPITDKQRLEWLIKNIDSLLTSDCDGGCCAYIESFSRRSIDAAIRASKAKRVGKKT